MEKNIDLNKKTPVWVTRCYYLCLLCGILFSISNSQMFGYIATLISLFVVAKARKEDIFIYLLGTQFLRAVLKVDLGFTNMSYLMFVYILWIFRFYLKRSKKLRVIECIPFVLFFWDMVVSFVWGVTKVGDNLLWTISLLVMVVTLIEDSKYVNLNGMIYYYCLAIWCVCLINVFKEFALYGQSLTPSMYGTFLSTGSYFSFGKAYAEVAGGNGIALDTILGIAMCIILIYEKEKEHRIFYLCTIVFFAYCGMMCVARAFYIEVGIFLFLFILAQTKKPLRFCGIVLGIIIVSQIAVISFSQYINPVILAVQRRFELGNADREGLLNSAKMLLLSKPSILMFGAGSYYPDVFNFTSHNLFYDILVSLGILGSIVYAIAILKTGIEYVIRCGKFSLLYFIPTIILISYKMISGSMRDVQFYYMLAMVLIFYMKMKWKEIRWKRI